MSVIYITFILNINLACRVIILVRAQLLYLFLKNRAPIFLTLYLSQQGRDKDKLLKEYMPIKLCFYPVKIIKVLITYMSLC